MWTTFISFRRRAVIKNAKRKKKRSYLKKGKALITATQKYGLNSAQVGLVRNLYQRSINTATQQIIGKSFTKAVGILNIATVANAIGSLFMCCLV